VAPPARRAVQPHQTRRLGRHAVGGHQLLLLADRAGEAERVRAEADQPDHRDQRQAQPRRARHTQARSRVGPVPARPKHEERQRQPGGDLDRDPRDQRGGAGAKAGVGSGREHQRAGQRQQQQRVVVIAADCQLEQHRVQAHERGCEARLAAFGKQPRQPRLPSSLGRDGRSAGRGVCGSTFDGGRSREERDRGEARGDREPLQRPQPAGHPERGDRVACEREQRAVGRVLEGPAHKQVHRVGGHLRGDVRVWVKPVQGAQPSEIEITKDILGDQWRPEQQHEVGGDDRRPQRAPGERACGEQYRHVARGHDQRERLKARRAEPHAEAPQRAGQPARPAAAARGHVLGWAARRTCREQEDAREQAEQTECAERAQRARGGRRCSRPGGARTAGRTSRRARGACQGNGLLHALIVTSRRSARL
jgi:hypothetical protein